MHGAIPARRRDIVDYSTILPIRKIRTSVMSATHSQVYSETLIVMFTNNEDLSANKASILSELCKREHWHCRCLKETQRSTDYTKPMISGMILVEVYTIHM